MRKLTFFLLLVLVMAAAVSCGGGKKDAAYYQAQIDSIRRAEQVKLMKHDAGVYDDPVGHFFDTLQLCPLPIESAGADIGRIGHFSHVPPAVASLLGFPVDTPLRIASLPRRGKCSVILLAQGPDSIAPVLTMVTLGAQYKPVDELTLYEQARAERGEEDGCNYQEYYITSGYSVVVMTFFQPRGDGKAQLLGVRRYVLDEEGYFREEILEL
jgi:hypothetical protein